MWKRVEVLINPASGSPQPVLRVINEFLHKLELEYHISVIHSPGDVHHLSTTAIERGVDAVAVYGGDGTIMEAAVALHTTQVPLVILPGGTANIIAHELSIPFLLPVALEVFSRPPELTSIDMGMCDDKPFVIRLNFGIFADMVTRTPPKDKSQLGTRSQTRVTLAFLDCLSCPTSKLTMAC